MDTPTQTAAEPVAEPAAEPCPVCGAALRVTEQPGEWETVPVDDIEGVKDCRVRTILVTTRCPVCGDPADAGLVH